MSNVDKPATLADQIRNNLALIMVIISLIFSYAQQTNKINVLELEIKELKQSQVDTYKNLNAISNDITYIRTTLEYLKTRI